MSNFKIDLFDFSGLQTINPSLKLTTKDIMSISELINEGYTMSADDAEALYYDNHDCESDDVDVEHTKIERWCDQMNIVVTD